MKEGWVVKKLGAVCEIQGGSTPKRTERLFWENGTYPWFTVDDIREQGRVITDTKQKVTLLAWDKLRKFPKDTIMLCCTASVGEYAITKIPITSNQQFNGLVIKDKDLLSPMYLFYYVSTLKHILKNLSGKATIDFVSAEKVRNLQIPIPPLPEQSRIVEELDLLSNIIEKKRQQLSELDNLAQSIFYDMFGDPVTNEKGWEVKTVGQLFELKAGKAIKANELVNEYEDGLYACYGGNGIRGYIPKFSHSGCYPIIGRQGALCGNVNLAKGDFYATEHAVVVSCNGNADAVWTYYCMVLMNLNRYAKGVAQPGISVNVINAVNIILPSLELQQLFAQKIEAIEKQKALIKQSIAETEELFNSRMDYYFS